MLFVRPYSNQLTNQVSAAASQPVSKEQQAESSPSGWGAWLFKDASGFFTFGLVIIGVGQAALFFVQLSIMRTGMDDATRAAKAAEDAAKAAGDQARIAGRSLTELERPWVFVFGVSRPDQDDSGYFFVSYTVANYGKMPAIIEFPRVGFVFENARGDPQEPPLVSEDHSLIATEILKAGEERVLREYFPDNQIGERRFRVLNEGTEYQTIHPIPPTEIGEDHMLFFRAVITYRGPVSTGHETGANWIYREPLDLVSRLDEYNYTN
jgi:hypothetical protein